MEELVAILLVAFLIVAYIVLYMLNHRTPTPEGVKVDVEKCSSCSNSGCGVKAKVVKKGGN